MSNFSAMLFKRRVPFGKTRILISCDKASSFPALLLHISSLPWNLTFSYYLIWRTKIYFLFKKNIVGGLRIIFHRYHKASENKIRNHEMTAEGNEPKMCQKIVGYDANVLYPWAIMQDMPTGAFARRRKINQGKTKSRKRNQQETKEINSWTHARDKSYFLVHPRSGT